MADLDALKQDLEHVLNHIPTEVVSVVHELATKVLDKYRAELPQIAWHAITKLQPHVKALGLELSTGMMELKELEPVLSRALEKVLHEKTGDARANADAQAADLNAGPHEKAGQTG